MTKIEILLNESHGVERDILESLPYVSDKFSMKTLEHVSGLKKKHIGGVLKKLSLMGYITELSNDMYNIDKVFKEELSLLVDGR